MGISKNDLEDYLHNHTLTKQKPWKFIQFQLHKSEIEPNIVEDNQYSFQFWKFYFQSDSVNFVNIFLGSMRFPSQLCCNIKKLFNKFGGPIKRKRKKHNHLVYFFLIENSKWKITTGQYFDNNWAEGIWFLQVSGAGKIKT